MEKIISFIVENWRIIADVCAALLALVLFICRKKPLKVVDGVKETLIGVLPDLIVEAEKAVGPGKGSEKLDLVLSMLKEYCSERFPDVNFGIYCDLYIDYIEDILSTPQKKGE